MPRSTNEELGAYLQHRVLEWEASGKAVLKLAKAAGLSRGQLSILKNTGTGAGWKTAEGLASAFGMSMPDLIDAARDYAATHPAPPPISPVEERRALAAKLSLKEERLPSEAVNSVLKEPLRDEDAEVTTFQWMLRMKRRAVEQAEALARGER